MEIQNWLQQSWLYLLAFAGGLTAILSLRKNVIELKNILSKPEQEQNTKIAENAEFIKLLKEERKEYLDNVNRWNAHQDVSAQNFASINSALTSLIRDRIHGYYFRKCMEKGYITPIELEILEQLYDNYVSLGGNGMISKEVETLRKLPIKE